MKKAIEWMQKIQIAVGGLFSLHLPSYSSIPDALSLHRHRSNLD